MRVADSGFFEEERGDGCLEYPKREDIPESAKFCFNKGTVTIYCGTCARGRAPAIVRGVTQQENQETGLAAVTKNSTKPSSRREKTTFGKDRRRKHHHFLVTVFYADGEKFGRVYTDKEKADRFADRQKRSPVVKSARVTQVS